MSNTWRGAIGGELTPDPGSVDHYFQRVTYRAGLERGPAALRPAGPAPLRPGRALGLRVSAAHGYPLESTVISLAFVYGIRGNTEFLNGNNGSSNVREDYLRVQVGLPSATAGLSSGGCNNAGVGGWLALLLAGLLAGGCQKKEDAPKKVVYKGPLLETENVVTLLSDSARLHARSLTAPLAQRFENGDLLYPKSAVITFYDKPGTKVVNTINAKWVKFDNAKQLYISARRGAGGQRAGAADAQHRRAVLQPQPAKNLHRQRHVRARANARRSAHRLRPNGQPGFRATEFAGLPARSPCPRLRVWESDNH
ncbi:MAG: hypothetical protein WKG07_08685 [Hymenobacter sp.]